MLKRQPIRISYNAPLTITFSIACTVVLLLNNLIFHHLIADFFTVTGNQASGIPFNWTLPIHYIRLFSHVLGHANWGHLAGNLTLILLLGPLLEERYGSALLLLMFAATAFVTGIINTAFMSTGLLGASGIVFMMILLSSFGSTKKDGIPLTFILTLVLYLGGQISTAFTSRNISVAAHVIGGLCGSIFGFAARPARRSPSKQPSPDKQKIDTKE